MESTVHGTKMLEGGWTAYGREKQAQVEALTGGRIQVVHTANRGKFLLAALPAAVLLIKPIPNREVLV